LLAGITPACAPLRPAVAALLLTLLAAGCATRMDAKQEETFTSYVNLGISYISQNNLVGAENALSRAANISNDDYRLTHAYALLAQFRGESKLADRLFRETLEEKPDFTRARNNYGVFLSTLDRDPEAIEQFTQAANDPAYDRREVAYENLAEVALKLNQPLQAIGAYQEARKHNPTRPRYNLRLAHLLAKQEEFEPALQHFREYLNLLTRTRRSPASEDMQLGVVIADRLGEKELENEYRARQVVLEELERTSGQQDNPQPAQGNE